MMTEAVPWLPPAPTGAVERLIAMLADSWAAEWIDAPARCRVSDADPSADGASIWHGAATAAVGMDPAQALELGQAIVADAGDPENPRDRDILEKLGEAAMAKLAAALVKATEADGAEKLCRPDANNTLYRLSGGHGWTAHISLGDLSAVRLRQHGAGRLHRPALGQMSRAFASERVRLGCHLGKAELFAGDLAALTKGDLIVLDRGTADDLPITIDGAAAATGKASVAAEAEGLVVRIRETPSLATGIY